MDILTAFFDPNKRDVARLRKRAEEINALEPRIQKLSDDGMRERMAEIRAEIHKAVADHGHPSPKVEDLLNKHLPEVFALVREASVRTIGLRNFDVQLMAGIGLHEGRIAEQKTGEGKTLTAVPALILNSLTGRGAHLVTVNDYLAKHGAEWMGPIYRMLGVSLGVLQHETRGNAKREVYQQDVVYGTNNEFGFDYLRDNMVIHQQEMTQGELNYAIVDECDSILIDEARTPLIISGTSNEDTSMYVRVDKVIRRLTGKDITGTDKPKDILEQALNRKYDDDSGKDWDYEFDRKHHSSALTARGIDKLEKELADSLAPDEDGELNLFAYINTEIAHYVQQSLRAHSLYEADVEYVVKDGQVIIVDEFTGRLMFGRRYSDGLHQAIEAKEGLNVKPESQTLATITIQNFFRQYHKLAGMTGTAKTEEEEFKKIYSMDVVVVPTHRPVSRVDQADVVYKTEGAKFNAIAEDVLERYARKQPILVGTTSIEKSERLGRLIQAKGVPCQVLNAKFHEQEAYIVAQAGRPGAVTIATNMAGRGTDIILGGNAEFAAREKLRGMGLNPDEHDGEIRTMVDELRPEYEKNKEEVLAAGGLAVLGSERHESRRIDNQLRGRSGRQGDPGESRFFLSLEDDLMKMYGGERVKSIMEMLRIEEDVPIESRLLSRSIENAQKKVEGRNFDIRKHVLQYDDVMNKQREVIYGERKRILMGETLEAQTQEFLASAVKHVVEENTMREGRQAEVDYEKLAQDIVLAFPIRDLHASDIEGKAPEEIEATLLTRVKELYKEKEDEITRVVAKRAFPEATDEELEARVKEIGPRHIREIERVITLKVIDELWIEHLSMLDQLRSGVSLRGYGQQDPVVIYAQEAFHEFNRLKEQIKFEAIKKIFLVRLQPQQQEVKAASAYNVQKASGPAGAAPTPLPRPTAAPKLRQGSIGQARQLTTDPAEGAQLQPRPAEKRIAPKINRNTLCYCGSGKKYKQCHLSEDGGNPPDNWVEMYEKAYGKPPTV